MSGRRIVVAGPYPTMPGPESAATFALVRELVAMGDDVTVVSPLPSAAHHHADPGGPRGAARLARFARGADLLHLRLDAAALEADDDSPRLLPGRLALAAVARVAGEFEVRLDRVAPTVSRQWVSVVLAKAGRVLVADESAQAALVAAGFDQARVEVSPDHDARPEVVVRRALPLADELSNPSAADLEALIRRRAAADRADGDRHASSADGAASIALRHIARMERPSVRSNIPGGALVKRTISKLTAWQYDNVIAAVNRLHQATIDSIDSLEGQAGDDTRR